MLKTMNLFRFNKILSLIIISVVDHYVLKIFLLLFISASRFCDNVWTFMLNDVEFREVQEIAKVDKVKIVACDGKSKLYLFIFCNAVLFNFL